MCSAQRGPVCLCSVIVHIGGDGGPQAAGKGWHGRLGGLVGAPEPTCFILISKEKGHLSNVKKNTYLVLTP